MKAYFFQRLAEGDVPAGYTVSKHPTLPVGDFRIDEYSWIEVTLWFIRKDRWTADERQAAYEAFLCDASITAPEPRDSPGWEGGFAKNH